jgi:hypothetical protein
VTTDHALAVAGGVLGGVLTALVARVLEHRLTRNTQVRPMGARRCRACAREYARVYRRRLA